MSCESLGFTCPIRPGKVLVVGAGSSGLIAARHFKDDGWTVTIVEERGDLGGTWEAAYSSARVQNSGEQYRFADFPMPKEIRADRFPNRDQLRSYFKAYVRHHGLDILFNTRPSAMTYVREKAGWSVSLVGVGGGNDSATKEFYEFVILATGYCSKPYTPPLPGKETFRGIIHHSANLSRFTRSDFSALFMGKKVAVVGMGKSAMDLVECAHESGATEIQQIARRARWMLPFKIGPVHISHVVMTRAVSSMVPSWTHTTRIEKSLHKGTASVPAAFWKVIEKLFAWIHGFEKSSPLYPKEPVTNALTYSIGVVTPAYHRLVRSNSITFHIPASIPALEGSSIHLSDATTIPDVDVLILATGSRSTGFDFLPETISSALVEDDGVHLYRGMIHPDVPALAFAGINSSYMHFVTTELGIQWLLAHLRGTVPLPPPSAIRASLDADRDWKRLHTPKESHRSAVSACYQQYVDLLCADLGVPVYRKLKKWGWWNPIGWAAEVLGQLDPTDFRGVKDEVEARHGKGKQPPAVAT
ncbi:FAD/NAD(P)-binding domain-containing protein [Gonapodya prolifera JEL478]|uniref:FAD/NAD(P)-binding domain-containing protein n=1 Tax=Gonapodya prolifera (strain JEL478) TaxID=1344416 RepID=A0A139A0U7_GONPJ|nr:FAD/NAD(P)-binding domain-containing protein [Gonapodya prolifera JEL478]|eukprot:KXS10400.1 FAD/NAD(P)-binding domain-containing protein [Gonapodya prolifera JEL478]